MKLPSKADGTPLTADDVLQRDLRNVLRKVAAGKVLTRAERELVQSAGCDGGGDHAEAGAAEREALPKRANDKNMRAIIEREFNVAERKAYLWLQKLRERYWSKTGNWRVADVIAEIEKRKDAATAGPDRDLRREKLALECDILRDRRDRERGEYVPTGEHRERVLSIVRAFRDAVDVWVKTTAAECGDPVVKRRLEDARRKAFGAIAAEWEAAGGGDAAGAVGTAGTAGAAVDAEGGAA